MATAVLLWRLLGGGSAVVMEWYICECDSYVSFHIYRGSSLSLSMSAPGFVDASDDAESQQLVRIVPHRNSKQTKASLPNACPGPTSSPVRIFVLCAGHARRRRSEAIIANAKATLRVGSSSSSSNDSRDCDIFYRVTYLKLIGGVSDQILRISQLDVSSRPPAVATVCIAMDRVD